MADINGLIFRATKAAGLTQQRSTTSQPALARARPLMLRHLAALFAYTSVQVDLRGTFRARNTLAIARFSHPRHERPTMEKKRRERLDLDYFGTASSRKSPLLSLQQTEHMIHRMFNAKRDR